MKNYMRSKKTGIRIIPFGGLGEIGKNMMAIEVDKEIFIIDCGVAFPGQLVTDVDFYIPDFSYVIENSERIKAILVTHGHEDHIGALPYLLKSISVPIYGSPLTNGLIRVKLKEHGLTAETELNDVEPSVPIKMGSVEIEFFRVCHSIPDAMGISIKTRLGKLIHTGDFKIDHTPVDGKATNFQAMSKLAGEGVLLLCSDSTYSENDGYTPSELIIEEAFGKVIGEAKGRVIVATFASLISRMQQVIDTAAKFERKVTIAGKSMVNNVKMARKMGYIKIPDDMLVPLDEAKKIKDNRIVILATGAQGEPSSALTRIANSNHKHLKIKSGDTIVVSASPIPGNEKAISKTIDNLFRQGADVFYSKNSQVHVHGHASREELKLMISLFKPKHFIPIHGEYRHLVAHARLARKTGVDKDKVFVIEDGDVLFLTEESAGVAGNIETDLVSVKGNKISSHQFDNNS
ncbi:uncharacterized protein METZ01_LOCUS219092 [marine metagenome]|uniref:Metallo-beta-lactamase domain-containing protein n=1 Tax=marine metagenome TaxID=408172 RepID=A0A382FT36_9ZZZZ